MPMMPTMCRHVFKWAMAPPTTSWRQLHVCAFLTPSCPTPTLQDGPLQLGEGKLTRRVAALAAGLKARLPQAHSRRLLSWDRSQAFHCSPQAQGLGVGDRAAIAAHTSLAFLEALLAVTAVGGIAVLLNWRGSPGDLAAACQLTQPRLLLADDALTTAQRGTLSPTLPLVSLGRTSKGLCAERLIYAHRGAGLAPVSSAEGAAVICFTSGTTGTPKGVLLSHASLCFQALTKLLLVGYCAADVFLHTAPLFHVGGLSSALAALAAGCSQVFMPAFRAAGALALMRQHCVTAFIAVPSMVEDLLVEQARTGAGCLPHVRRVLLGGGPLVPEQANRLQALCPEAQLTLAYGMSEAGSSMTFQPLGGPVLPLKPHIPPGAACVGRPPPGIRLAIRPLAQPGPREPPRPGNDLQGAATRGPAAVWDGNPSAGRCVTENPSPLSPPSQAGRVAGEVLTAGPHTMLRYWGDPAATAAAQAPGGWLRTGDLGCLDSGGRLWLGGRLGDVIRSGAESVPAAEVEAALLAVPGVSGAAVVGLPDPRLGERVGAALVLAPGWALSAEEGWEEQKMPDSGRKEGTLTLASVRAALTARGLAAYKHPRVVVALPELPRGGSGKVAKMAVRERLVASQRQPRSRL